MEKRSFHEVAYSLGLSEMPDHYVIAEETAVFVNLQGKQLCPESLAIAEQRLAEERFLAHVYAVAETAKELVEEDFTVCLDDGDFYFEPKEELDVPANTQIDYLLRKTSRDKTRRIFSRNEKLFLDSISKSALSGEEMLQSTQSPRTIH